MKQIRPMLLKYVLAASMLAGIHPILAQDTTWYDARWNTTMADSAAFFFTAPYPQKTTPTELPATIDTRPSSLYTLKNNRRVLKIDFCHTLIPDSLLLHRKVKIYNLDHHYPTLNTTTPGIDWPGEEIREKSGAGYGDWKSPNPGDVLEIVWVFKDFPDPETRKKHPDRMYLLKSGEYYVAVSGKGLTMPDKPAWVPPSYEEESQRKASRERHFILAPGIVVQKQFYGELNLLYTKIDCSPYFPCAMYGPFAGIESNFNRDWVYGFKAGYQFACAFLSLRASAVTYIDNAHTDLRLLPEIGISCFGFVNLNYGYSIPMLGFESDQLSRHRLSLVVNLTDQLW